MIKKILQYQEVWGDNSDPYNPERGIAKFAKMCFPDAVYDVTPNVHLEIYRELLQLYNPKYTYATQRQLQEILFRGAAKSTISSFIFPTYIICFNGLKIKIADWERFELEPKLREDPLVEKGRLLNYNGIEVNINEDVILVLSETGDNAENWITRIRGELGRNKLIRSIFGNMKSESAKDDEGKWTKRAFTVIKSTLQHPYTGKDVAVIGKGTNMQQRGTNIRGRITLAIWDDLYGTSNIQTPESRRKVRYIVTQESKNSFDPVRGKVVSIGTVVHDDTVVVDNQKSRFWYCITYPIMEESLFREVLTNYCKIDRANARCEYPDAETCRMLESQGYKTYWAGRWTLEMLVVKFAEAIEERTEGGFWQEYFHITVPNELKIISSSMMQVVDLSKLVTKNINGRHVSFIKFPLVDKPVNETDYEYRNVNLAFSLDIATAYGIDNDNSALVLIGKDSSGRLYVFRTLYGKFGMSDEIDIQHENKYLGKLCTERSHIKRIGSLDEIFRWLIGTKHYPLIVIETNNAGGEAIKQFRTKMRTYGMIYRYIERYQTKNKLERIMDTLQPYYQSRVVYHNRNLEQLQYELEYLGKAKTDDVADAVATGVLELNKPVFIDYNKRVTEDKTKGLRPLKASGLVIKQNSNDNQDRWKWTTL